MTNSTAPTWSVVTRNHGKFKVSASSWRVAPDGLLVQFVTGSGAMVAAFALAEIVAIEQVA